MPNPPPHPTHRAAACYLRSSKDRSDLSIDAQRRALHDHARDQGLAIVAEYADAVESGADDQRPGFQRLLAALKDRTRGWTALLVLDTSRIARRRHLALIFEHEAEKTGIAILYKSVPDTDPITAMLLRSILQAMDEWHSLTSKAKGLAGMAESIRQGWRAGGRAPRGYRLEHSPTGVLREGAPVMRSKLILAPDAEAVGRYLRARAAGKPRGIASQLSGIVGSLNDLEWQALTYAGHTCWNQTAERGPAGYVGGSKHRPRGEWHITRDTHQPLITDAEAEAILAQLAAKAGRRNRAGERVYLLSGLLIAPDGQPYAGETSKGQAAYRLGKGGRIAARLIEAAVLDQVFADLAAPDTAKLIGERLRAHAAPVARPRDLAALKRKLATLDSKIDRLVGLIAEDVDAAPAYRRAIAGMEAERAAVGGELAEATTAARQATVVPMFGPEEVLRMLASLRTALEADLAEARTQAARDTLHLLIDQVVLDLETRQWEIHYQLTTGVKMASPRGAPAAPGVRWVSRGTVPRRMAA